MTLPLAKLHQLWTKLESELEEAFEEGDPTCTLATRAVAKLLQEEGIPYKIADGEFQTQGHWFIVAEDHIIDFGNNIEDHAIETGEIKPKILPYPHKDYQVDSLNDLPEVEHLLRLFGSAKRGSVELYEEITTDPHPKALCPTCGKPSKVIFGDDQYVNLVCPGGHTWNWEEGKHSTFKFVVPPELLVPKLKEQKSQGKSDPLKEVAAILLDRNETKLALKVLHLL